MSAGDLKHYSKRLVQYFWDPVPRNDDSDSSPLWCLGVQYDSKSPSPRASVPSTTSNRELAVPLQKPGASPSSAAGTTTEESPEEKTNHSQNHEETTDLHEDGGWPVPFLDDFESRIWMTYRSNFPPIAKSQDPKAASAMSFSVRLKNQLASQGGFTSDTGWACMIRSGQSLLANALLLLRSGRGWRRTSVGDAGERELLSLFADDPRASFSLHRFVEHGASACGKHPGEWFGPSATARCIQALTNAYHAAGLKVYITGDGSDVYEDGVSKVAVSSDGTFQPVLLLVGTRLGIDRVTPVYWEALKSSLQMPQSVGIAGGRPSASHYFVGTQGPHFFYLDPHTTRPAIPLHASPADYSPEEIATFHTRRLRRIHIREMDPSMLIGFLIRDEADWRAWRRAVECVQGKRIVHVADREAGTGGAEGRAGEREGAIDEVETFDDEDDA